jgi:signal transduction histidine kinase/DNA-binding response OmpR family regulator/ligand-binding sensor domain-containing protein
MHIIKRIEYSLTLLITCLFFNLQAAEMTLRQVSVAKQLPSNTVYRMFQDRDGFVWLGTPNGFCRYDGYDMKSFRSEIANPTFSSNYISGGFAEDTLNHTLWTGTEKGVWILDKLTGAITPLDTALLGMSPVRRILYADNAMWVCTDYGLYLYNTDKSLRKKYLNGANSIHIDRQGTVRVTVWAGGIYYLDKATDTFIPYPGIGDKNNPHKIFQDNAGRFWICTWGDGFFRFYPDRQGKDMYKRIIVPDDKNLDLGIFFDIEQDDVNGYLWVLSYAGVTVLKPDDDDNMVPVNELAAKINERTNLFSVIMKDRDGNLWFGTYYQGAIMCNPAPSAVTNFDLQTIKTETGYIPNIMTVFEDKDGELWMKQNRLGVYLLHPETSEINKINIPEINAAISICHCSASNEIWVATDYDSNIFRLRKSNGKIALTGTMNMRTVLPESPQIVRFLHEDKNGVIWAATRNALLSWTPDDWHVVESNCGTITGITEDSYGAIWLSTAENGLLQIVPGGKETVNRYNINTCRIAGNHISCIDADAEGRLWFCANENRLYRYDISRQELWDYTSKANINNLVISNVIVGDNGHIWISSNKQIEEFNPVTGASIEYDMQNDLIITSLDANSVTKTRNGSIVFGGNGGICLFTPSQKMDTPAGKVKTVITDINSGRRESVRHEAPASRVGRSAKLEFRSSQILLPDERNIEISFSSFNYPNPDKTRYAYKLEGVDEQWIYPEPGRRFAVYNQLRKGEYTFLVKSTDNNRLWSEEITRLVIVKKPAFYENSWAYAGYTVIMLLILFGGLRFYIWRIKLRNELHIAQIDKTKSEELTQTKLRFFTNIGHEFRTPLTLIMTPLGTLIHQLTDENLKQKLGSIYRHTEDLLGLINQLLDFRKLEMGGEKLKLSCNDFVKFAGYVYLTFKDIAENKSILFTFESDAKQLFMVFDKSKVRKIINNLYSNALKFTPDEGYIATTIRLVQDGGREFVRLDIADSGSGIPEKEQQTIFERFYQSENNDPDKTGSGIGLHLVKEYVELHGGHISVSSKVGEGSRFSVFVPADLQLADGNNGIDAVFANATETAAMETDNNKQEQRTLLIVEDNAELRSFLAEQLSGKFNVLQAADGKQGEEVARKKSPDLIVSDLMMPVLNGLEMCHRLKTDIQTSHIPVILLTAQLSDEIKIESYKAGADSYIAKPFNFEVLLTRIEMLIEQQEKRKELFHKTIEITPSSITITSLDEEFIKKTLQLVEKNIDNSEYSVDDLSSDLGLSRSNLYRKFQSITGLSPNDFIRSIRLKRAAQLLKASQYNVSEISDIVGFNSIKYFNKYFKEEFGMTPTQYRNFSPHRHIGT